VPKRHLLLVDADPRALTITEVNLKRAGFTVTTAVDGRDALAKCRASPPDLILSEIKMPEMDGFELCQRLKEDERFKRMPFIFLTTQKSLEYKVTGLELGVEDYLTRPIYFREIVTRISILLQRRERELLDRKEQKGGFSGNLTDVGLVDVLQPLEMGKKSGKLHIDGPDGRTADVYLSEGNIIDCEAGKLVGESAFFRILSWQEGEFAITFKPVARQQRIATSNQSLIMEGLRRIDECGYVLEQLPALGEIVTVDQARLDVLVETPEHSRGILQIIDGHRTLGEVLEGAECDDLAAAQALAQLFHSGAIRTGPIPAAPRPAPLPALSPAHVGPSASQTPPPRSVAWFATPDAARATVRDGSEAVWPVTGRWLLAPGSAPPGESAEGSGGEADAT
jgi:CheY-like chemotaxis protein